MVASLTPETERRKRVLLVDDEKALLPLLERYLRKLGYDPTSFSEPGPALAAFRAAVDGFDLVMTDLTLEGLSGEELAKLILAESPAMRVIVMSGYPYSTDHFAEEDRGRVAFLQKPFLPQQFLEAVERFTRPVETAEPVEAESGARPEPVAESVEAVAESVAAEAEPVEAEAEPVEAEAAAQPCPGSEAMAKAD